MAPAAAHLEAGAEGCVLPCPTGRLAGEREGTALLTTLLPNSEVCVGAGGSRSLHGFGADGDHTGQRDTVAMMAAVLAVSIAYQMPAVCQHCGQPLRHSLHLILSMVSLCRTGGKIEEE